MLTEQVEIWSIDPPQKMTTCRLAVDAHGLPVLLNAVPATQAWEFPAAWKLHAPLGKPGVLLSAWWHICDMRREIIDAQREAEKETPNAGE